MSRDFSPLFDKESRCVICHQPRTIAGRDVHSEYHMQRGEALVHSRIVRGEIVERVLPHPDIPNTGHDEALKSRRDGEMRDIASPAVPRSVFTRKLDPKLKRIVRAHVKRKGS